MNYKAKVVEDGIDLHVQEQTRFRPPLVNLATLIRRCLKKKEKLDFQKVSQVKNRPLVFHWIYKSASWGEVQPYKGKRFLSWKTFHFSKVYINPYTVESLAKEYCLADRY